MGGRSYAAVEEGHVGVREATPREVDTVVVGGIAVAEEAKYRYAVDFGSSLDQVHALAMVRQLESFVVVVVQRHSFAAACVRSLYTDSSTDLVLVETLIAAVPVALSFGIEETSGSGERRFSLAHTLAGFVALEVKLAGRNDFVAAVENFLSLSHNFDRAPAVGWEIGYTGSVVI